MRLALLIAVCSGTSFLYADVSADVGDLFRRRCLGCHNAQLKVGGLDLSTRQSALRGGSRGPALNTGSPADSLLLARVMSGEMPPAAPLPDIEKETLRRWLESGSVWPAFGQPQRADLGWWSLQPLEIRPPPDGAPAGWSRSPIDAWIYAGLRRKGLPPSPPADRRTLIRRLSFDVLGLPPSPEEVKAFENDGRPDAYERLVNRLLASPQYGERWARHWLDIVRFAESEGFERDWLRDHAWTYRDYVIRSFNADKPYRQFALEQIAGDVLRPATHDGLSATGLLVLGPLDAVGLTSAVPQEREMVREDQLEELVGVISQTFLGLTVNCARCHDHKFDPIPQQDYYRFKAALEGVWQPTEGDELKADGVFLLTPAERDARNRRIAGIERRIGRIEEDLARLYGSVRPSLQTEPAPVAQWSFDADTRDLIGSLHAPYSDDAVVHEGRLRPASGKDSITLATPALGFDLREKTLEVWIHAGKLPEKGATVLRIRNRAGFRGAAFDGIRYAAGENKQWENFSTVRFRTEDVGGPPEDAAPGSRLHIAITYDPGGSIQIYRNGRAHGRAYRPDASLPAGRLQTYLQGDAVVELTSSKDLEIEEARIYGHALTAEQIAGSFRRFQGSRSEGLSEKDLLQALPEAGRAKAAALKAQLRGARSERKSLPEPPKAFAVLTRQPEPTRLLVRGDVNRKSDTVTPGGVSCIAGRSGDLGLPADAPEAERRLRLAAWIADAGNPLFARVMVNRVWHYHFGAGLVENPNDFGYNGGRPSHPELLDWLAGEFIRGGWSVKSLHRLILTSQTYRQSSVFRSEASAIDADNRLLWRHTPRRLSGEAVRDAALAVSGRLNGEMFGPSFRPFTIVRNAGSYHSYQPADSEEAGYQRRTVYRMNVNSGGDPMLDALDCPVPSVKTPKRLTTATALQALSLMNNSLVNRLAKDFAERLVAENSGTAARVDRAFRLALGRPPRPEEAERSRALVERNGLEALCWGLFNTSEFLHVR